MQVYRNTTWFILIYKSRTTLFGGRLFKGCCYWDFDDGRFHFLGKSLKLRLDT